jgi:hypothetical protein
MRHSLLAIQLAVLPREVDTEVEAAEADTTGWSRPPRLKLLLGLVLSAVVARTLSSSGCAPLVSSVVLRTLLLDLMGIADMVLCGRNLDTVVPDC